MARVLERRRVIELRKQGKTYSEIKAQLGIAKSTLSDWLRGYPLTEEQMNLLGKNQKLNKALSIEKISLIKQEKRKNRIDKIYMNEQRRWISLTERELEIAGLFLYWGEGGKRMNGPVSLNNTDPEVVLFTKYWLENALHVPLEKIRVALHLYKDMNKKEAIQYWSTLLDLPQKQFFKPYIKNSNKSDIDHKGFGHGTCGLIVNDVRLKERVMMAIKAISDYYSHKNEAMLY